jgi:glycosyltransferase involved in cell wall biosynthesis
MEEPPRPAPDTAAKYGLDETPYVVCLGRVELGKGAGALHKAFLAYKQRRPRPLRLVFVGPDLEHFVDDPDIVMTGAVDEAEKWDLLRGSEFCISPSAMESFSFVVLEAWQAGVPVLVNRRCDATVEHALRGRGGLWFDDYPSFEATMDRLIADADLRERLAANGLAYAEANFDWHVLVRRYAAFLEGLSPAGPVLPSAS